MKTKGFIIIIGLFIFGTISSCVDNLCDDYKFMDYSGIEVGYYDAIIPHGDSLTIRIDLVDLELMATTNSRFSVNNLMAQFDCDKGWGGYKYPLTRISIKSNQDFNANFPAQTDLNSLMKVRGWNSSGDYVFDYMTKFNVSEINEAYWYLSERPDSSVTHQLTFEFEKSNGEIFTATTENITWE